MGLLIIGSRKLEKQKIKCFDLVNRLALQLSLRAVQHAPVMERTDIVGVSKKE